MDAPAPDPDRDPPSRGVPAIRASDSEREQTARFLQESYSEGRLTLAEFDDRIAAAYAAQFRTDLAALTSDLPLPARLDHPAPEHPPQRPPARPGDRAPARRVTGGSGPNSSIAVMSGIQRTGPWTLPAQHTAVAVMGGVEIDLRSADLQAREITIQAFAFWGGIEILIPDDVHVHVDGIGFMGAFSEVGDDDALPVRHPPAGAPVIRVTGLALMAGVEVRRVPDAGGS